MRFCTVLHTLLLMAALGLSAPAQQNVITTRVGGGPNNVPAIDADLFGPVALALDSAANYYIAANSQNRVFKVATNGTLTVVAGLGIPGYGGDTVPGGAANALLNSPAGVAVDGAGNIYIADFNNSVIRMVDGTNTITTIAGIQGACGYSGDGTPATSFKLCNPAGLTLDGLGNLYIADSGNCRIRKLTLATNTISTYAGTGKCAFGGDNGPAASAQLNGPVGVGTDAAGNVYIADTLNFRIRQVSQVTGNIVSIAGTGVRGLHGDGGPAVNAQIGLVYQGISVNPAGTSVLISDYTNYRVRQFAIGGSISTVAGNGNPSYCGDGGAAASACLNHPQGIVVTGSGLILVADTDNYRIRQFTQGGSITTIAGNGSAALATPVNGVPANGVVLNYPYAAIEDPSGNIFVSDQNNSMIRELVQSTNLVDFFAGNGTASYGGDGGPATQAQLENTFGVARDSSGNIYIADAYNQIIRQVNPSGVINTIAGMPGNCGYSGDGGQATNALLCSPQGVFVDGQDRLYIADTGNNVVRVVTNGVITTFAGTGAAGFLGDGGPATAAQLNLPNAVTGDGLGNVYIADTQNCVIREVVAATAIINTVAGNGVCGFSGDGLATQNELYYPTGVVADVNGNLFIADTYNNRLRWVDLTGSMTTFAGTGTAGYTGDGGQATSAELDSPTGIAEDTSGNFVVSDQNNLRLRGITAFAGVNTSSKNLSFAPSAQGLPSAAQALKPSGVGPATITGISTTGDFAQTNNCGSSLPNGQTCNVQVTFKPRAAGTRKGTLTINSNGFFNGSVKVSLKGTGGYVSFKGGPVSFGKLKVGTTSAPKSVTVTNKGTTALSMGDISLDQTTDFAIYSNSCPPPGSTLAAGANCVIQLTFRPQATGLKTGTVTVSDSDISTPQKVALSGTGTR